MSTAAAPSHAVRRPTVSHDRIFYTGMALLMALTVFTGFARTFYLRAYIPTPTISGATVLTPLMYVHGAVFTAWVVLFLVQTALVSSRRVAVHRRLGIAGIVLAAAMVVVGLRTAITAAAKGSAPPGLDPLAFMLVPFTDMVLFTLFVSTAFVKRRDRGWRTTRRPPRPAGTLSATTANSSAESSRLSPCTIRSHRRRTSAMPLRRP